MCNVFRYKSIKGFLTGSHMHFLHLHKMVEETWKTLRELKIFKGFLKLADVDISIVLAEWAKTQNWGEA